MVEMLMRRRSLLMASGPRPEPSDDGWELLTSYTTSGTWTAPWDGWFRLSCIGAGGTGGNGGVGVNNQSAPDDQESVSGSGGGGGGSGGFSSSVLYLKKGDSLSYSYNGNATLTVGIQGENITMVATVGGIGNNGSKGNIRHAIEYDPPRWVVTVPNGGTGGTAGTASGGNKINSNGLLGGTGSRGTVGKKTTATNGGSGCIQCDS